MEAHAATAEHAHGPPEAHQSSRIDRQTLGILLQFLGSDDLQVRQSHFAFAISRAVKREAFAWAAREGSKHALLDYNGDAFALFASDEPFERYTQLRHFLDRCVTRGDLTGAELDLLVRFKRRTPTKTLSKHPMEFSQTLSGRDSSDCLPSCGAWRDNTLSPSPLARELLAAAGLDRTSRPSRRCGSVVVRYARRFLPPKCNLLKARVIMYAYQHVRLLPPESLVVNQSVLRSREPTLFMQSNGNWSNNTLRHLSG